MQNSRPSVNKKETTSTIVSCAVGESRICFCNQFIYNDLRKLEKKPGVKEV